VSQILDKIEKIEKHYDELEQLMGQPDVVSDIARLTVLARERASLEDTITKYRQYKQTVKSLEETRSLLESHLDAEMETMVKQEIKDLEAKRAQLESELQVALIPKDPNDVRDVIVEIRAAAGGDEAALFAGDLFRMYSRYALNRKWIVEIIDSSLGPSGGFKEVVFEVKGKGAYSRLKHESGVHRVQRVPTTEAGGRIHTSTATVAVLPEADEVEINIGPNDLRIDIFHASGAGGQNVNKVSTAVRLTHYPSGLVVVCQDERSQLKNRQKAMAVLRARLYDMERREQEVGIAQERRSQVGAGDRSEKIRTYNFPQNRITDHRIGLTIHNLAGVMEGDLEEMIDTLITSEREKQLEGSRL
jgi:peptide chain release factor 1